MTLSKMKKLNLLGSFPKSIRDLTNRKVSKKDILLANKFAKDYFDGPRSRGYGGYYYDGRWVPVAKKIKKLFKLKSGSKILDIGCAKGFLIYDLHNLNRKYKLLGIDISKYAVKNSNKKISKFLKIMSCENLSIFEDNYFDAVIAINVVHNLSKTKCKKVIKEIQRISGGNAFIQVDAYRNKHELNIFKKWVLTAKTYLRPNQWLKLFKECGYQGYFFYTILKDDKWLKK